MRRAQFTRRQRLVLIVMGAATLLVFGALGYSVYTTLNRLPSSPPAEAYVPPSLYPLYTATPGSPLPSPASPNAPSPTPSPTPTPLSQLDNARAVGELSQIVAGVRSLPAVEQVPVSFHSELEVSVALLQRYEEEQPQEILSLYSTLGLIPAMESLPKPDYVAQSAHISSLYLPVEKEVLLITGRGPTTTADELAVVRALARAVQDQQFELETMAPCQPTTDARLALQALIEGDAIFTTALYAHSEPSGEELERLAEMAAAAEAPTYAELAEAPIFERLHIFPYQEGAYLVASLYEEGGWSRVNRSYARPPCSTAHVLHPARYLEREPVEEVAIPDLSSVLGEGWSLEWRDVLGEYLIGLHLVAHLEEEAAVWDTVAGWTGDTFVQWENEEGESLIIWRIAWQDRSQAQRFEALYRLLVPHFRTPPLVTADEPHRLPGRLWSGPAGAAYIARAGRVTTLIWGPDMDVVMDVAQALP